ncbi:hypothetical protein ACFL0D_07100, partial [Thermoproteota archaeon]
MIPLRYLTFNDLINAAVITSNVEIQQIAERIATEILFNVGPDEPLPQPDLSGDDVLSLLKKTDEKQITVSL